MSPAWTRPTVKRHRREGLLLLAAATLVVGVMGLPAASPAAAASPPDTVDTGDPPPPADPPPPDGLDQAVPAPDDSVVATPPSAPGIVPNANTVAMAWVGTPDQRPADSALITLQAALNTVPVGGTVSFDPGDYAFTGALTASRLVTLDTSAASMLYTRFTVSGGGLELADDVTIGAASTGAVVNVTASGATLTNITIRNPTPVLRPTGIQLGAGITGVTVEGADLDGADQASSYGINLTTGSATVSNPTITGFATGILVTAASTASGVQVSGGSITATTAGVSLGTTTAPRVTGVEVTGTPGTGTGIDLAASSAAVVDAAVVHGFARGIGTATTNTSTGPTITGPAVDGTTREGIALGTTTGARVTDARVTLTGALQSTGIVVLSATGVVIERPTISVAMYGITTSVANTGAGPTVTDPTIEAQGAITLGSTQGATVTGAVLDAGPWASGTGVNTVNAGRVTISDLTATGFLYAVAAQSTFDPTSDRVDISVSDVDVVGAPNASHAVYLLGARNATVSRVTADITGAALVIHQSIGVQAQDITVTGHEGPTSVTGAAILRAYSSQDVSVDRSSIDAGSYGFFYSATDGANVTNATVAGVVEYGIYGRSVANLDVGATSISTSSAVALFVTTTPADGLSHDISLHDNVLTGNTSGILALQGTTDLQVVRNTVSGQGDVVTAGPAHRLLMADNTVDQTGQPDRAAVTVAPLWQDAALAGSYSSSDIEVRGNVFTGTGTWIQVGTSDAASEAAARRTLRDDVLVTGNSFPAGTVAVRTYPNAVVGDDTAPSGLVLPVDGPVAVDARDYDDPNDWGSPCRATGFLDDTLYYDGGGAEVRELTEAPVLYPMTCIDLSLTEELDGAASAVYQVGDLVSWTLTPHNDGPRVAPAGWTITQLLPAGAQLVSITGAGYTTAGLVATADADLAVGADGPPLRVTVRLDTVPSDEPSMRNVAYVAPAAPDTDLDGDGAVDLIVEQHSPLEIPTIDTDTDTSATDNDAQGVWLLADVIPAPPGPDDGGDTPGTDTDGDGGAGGGDGTGADGTSGTGSRGHGLASSGAEVRSAAFLAALLTAVGTALVASRRRAHLQRP